MKKLLISLTLAVTVIQSVAAQVIDSSLPQMFTPNAAELGKYGRTPVN